MSERKNFGGVFIGISSILVIFIVLCLTTFATLSLVSANADRKMADRAAQAVSDYYAADAQAVTLFADIDHAVAQAGTASTELLSALFPSTAVSSRLYTTMISYSIPINSNSELHVTLCYRGTHCEITQWQVVSTHTWEGDETINLWDGGMDLIGSSPLNDKSKECN